MLSKLFGGSKKEEAPVNALQFVVLPGGNMMDDTLSSDDFVALEMKNPQAFHDFLRNYQSEIDITAHSDQELAHLFLYQYAQRWLAENLKKPMFVETHYFESHGEIRYDRAWNTSFANAAAKLGFETLPPSEPELIEMYMNYVYGTRLMEEMEAMAEANPQSVAHPELTHPDNKFQKG